MEAGRRRLQRRLHYAGGSTRGRDNRTAKTAQVGRLDVATIARREQHAAKPSK